MAEPVLVTLPDGNWVRLAPRLSLTAGAACVEAMRRAEATASEMEAAITASFLRHGIVADLQASPIGCVGVQPGPSGSRSFDQNGGF